MRKVVVLPAPLGPSRPNTSPRCTEKEVLFTAVKSPNLRTRFFTSMTVPGGAVAFGATRRAALPAPETGLGAGWMARSRTMKPSSSRASAGLALAPASRAAGAGRLRMKRTSPPWGTASTVSGSSCSRACSTRAISPWGGVAMKTRPLACSRISPGVPSASTLPWCRMNTRAQRSASSR